MANGVIKRPGKKWELISSHMGGQYYPIPDYNNVDEFLFTVTYDDWVSTILIAKEQLVDGEVNYFQFGSAAMQILLYINMGNGHQLYQLSNLKYNGTSQDITTIPIKLYVRR